VTDEQIGSVAAGFLHALQVSTTLYAEWTAVNPGDTAAYGQIMQRVMHLAAAPSLNDMTAMDAYLRAHLPEQISAFVKTHKLPPQLLLLCMATQT
jgi:hypothetical protein